MKADAGRCWLVAFSSFFISFLVYGFAYGIGVFYDEFLDVFNESKGKTAWISSLNYGILCGTGPVGSVLIDKLGCRATIIVGAILSFASLVVSSFATSIYFLLVSLGICTGAGFGISYMGITVVMSLFFSKYRAIALGIGVSGSAIGTIVFPLMNNYLLSMFSWKGTLMICGALHLHTVAAALLIPAKSPLTFKKDTTSDAKDQDAEPQQDMGWSFIKNFGFILFCLNNFIFCMGLFVVYTHMASYARSLGQSKYFGNLLISLSGIASFLGRLGLTGIAQLKLLQAPTLYAISFFMSGVGTILSGAWVTKAGIITTTFNFGFFSSAYGALSPEATCCIVGVKDLNKAFGLAMLSSAVGIILGPPIAGFIHDHTGFYPASFYFGGACMVFSAFVLLPVILKCTGGRHQLNQMATEEIKVPVTKETNT